MRKKSETTRLIIGLRTTSSQACWNANGGFRQPVLDKLSDGCIQRLPWTFEPGKVFVLGEKLCCRLLLQPALLVHSSTLLLRITLR